MKNDDGVTLISLIVYVILMTFIVAAVTLITSSFRTSMDEFEGESESTVAYSKFNMYFVNDIKRNGARIEECYNDEVILSYIKDDEIIKIEYKVENNTLYRDKVKICDNVKNVLFTQGIEKNKVTVDLTINNYSKKTTYVIENIGITNNNTENI